MTDTVKISELAELTTTSEDDLLVIVDVSEALDADKTKKIEIANLNISHIAAKVLKNGDQTISPIETAHLTGWTVDFDDDSLWDGSNNRFKITKAGIYAVYLNGIIDDNLRIQGRIRHLTGSTNQWIARQHFENSNTYSGFSAFAIGSFSIGDYLYPYVYNDQGSDSYDVLASETSTYTFYTQFGIFQIA